MSKLYPFLLSLLAGGIYALAYPSFLGEGFFPLLFLGLIPFLYNLHKELSWKKRLIHVFLYNTGLNITGYYWIPQTLVEFGQLPYPLAFSIGLFAGLILQPHWWIYALFPILNKKESVMNSSTISLVAAILISLLEFVVPQQFSSYAGSPWLHLAPYLGLAPYFGVIAFSFFTYWIALEIIRYIQYREFSKLSGCSILIFFLFNILMPLEKNTSGEEFRVRLVQPNIGNFMKVSSEKGDRNSYYQISQRYLNLSTQNNEFNPDLIIWPETAHPETMMGTETRLNELFLNILDKSQAELLIGGYDHNQEKGLMEVYESTFNASLLMSKDKVKSVYYKNVLIPFGETLPFGPLNETIVGWIPAISLFARGEGTPLMETRDGWRFITPICYEILLPSFIRDLLNTHKNNHFIVNHSNDSWYGNTAEPYQHLFLSKWRALEFNLPIIRITNTGISSVIYPDGSESERLLIGEEKVLDTKLKLNKQSSATIYQKFGIYTFLLLISILLLSRVFKSR